LQRFVNTAQVKGFENCNRFTSRMWGDGTSATARGYHSQIWPCAFLVGCKLCSTVLHHASIQSLNAYQLPVKKFSVKTDKQKHCS